MNAPVTGLAKRHEVLVLVVATVPINVVDIQIRFAAVLPAYPAHPRIALQNALPDRDPTRNVVSPCVA